MRKIARLALVASLALAALLAVGCVSGFEGGSSDIDLPSGRLSYTSTALSIVLDENATTGYAWTCEADGAAVESAGDESLSAKDLGKREEENLTGAPGAHLFEFSLTGSGETAIVLRYERSWGTADPAKIVVIHVTVEDGVVAQVEAEERQSELRNGEGGGQ